MSNIKDLKFDDKNFNKHTEFGMSLLEKSLREHGAGRSVLVDKNNKLIAGNGIIEAAGSIGLEKTKVIETTGDEIVVVKRTDVDLDTQKGHEMAMADNATSAANLSWDENALIDNFAEDELGAWGVKLKGFEDIDFDNIESNENRKTEKQAIRVKCPDCGKEFEV